MRIINLKNYICKFQHLNLTLGKKRLIPILEEEKKQKFVETNFEHF